MYRQLDEDAGGDLRMHGRARHAHAHEVLNQSGSDHVASRREYLVRTAVAEPLALREFWFPVPDQERRHIAKLFPRINPFGIPWGVTSFALSRTPGLKNLAAAGMPEGFDELVHNPAIHDHLMPGWNWVFNARAPARVCAAIANHGMVDGIRFLSKETVAQIGEGLGGSGAFADPDTGRSVAFVTNRMGNTLTPLAGLRLAELGATAESIARRL
ncbi:hypothetical protein MLGJGCBP_08165 [Rhodococcus sp. T7]|nr:hypothetical protein MLGJGCBP_08165 [Rhodococcus sp. T7]